MQYDAEDNNRQMADAGGQKGRRQIMSDKLDDQWCEAPEDATDDNDKDDKDKDNQTEDNREMSDKLPDWPYDQWRVTARNGWVCLHLARTTLG